jgi:hypothetical protein
MVRVMGEAAELSDMYVVANAMSCEAALSLGWRRR